MARLTDRIKAAVRDGRVVVSLHADERLEERAVTAWQLIAGLDEARLLRDRPNSKPNPSIIMRHVLPDGNEVAAIWSYLASSDRAKLVTVYFEGEITP